MTQTPTSQPTPVQPAAFTRRLNRKARALNVVMKVFCTAVAALAVTCLFLVFGYIMYRGAEYVNIAFFTHSMMDQPSGLLNCIVGTLIMVGLASVVGVPVGMCCGVYLAEYARNNRLSHILRLVVDVLAGTPSILVGVMAYVIFVRPINHYHGAALKIMLALKTVVPFIGLGQQSGWAGAMALAFVMCPIVARTTEEMLKLVPEQLREASIGLGASRAQTLLRVVIPTAKTGIITGVMLAIARIAGETAPLLFTAGGNNYLKFNPNRPMAALTLQIYTDYQSPPRPSWRHQTWSAMVVLIVMIVVFNLAVRFATRKKYGASR